MPSPSEHRPASQGRRALLWLAAPLWLGLQACTPMSMNANATPGTPATPAQAPLWGTEWRLLSLGDQPVMANSTATLAFPEAGRAGGNGSCNRFFGSVSIEQDRITFSAIGSTKMACMGGASAQESAYLAALHKAERFERQGDTLLIYVQGMQQPLRLALNTP